MQSVKETLGKNLNIKELERSYDSALQDEYFQMIVKELDLPKEILQKYTSLLEDASRELACCNNCKSLSNCQNAIKGYCYKASNIAGEPSFSYRACKYLQSELARTKYEQNVQLYREPALLKKAKMKDIYFSEERVEIIKYLDDYYKNFFKKRRKGLYLYGSFGSGKTYLIASLFNELAKKDVCSVIIYFPEFLRELKASFALKEEGIRFEDKFSFVKKAPLLLIDDIGAENITVWARDEVLGPILQYRMEADLPTFFTSNLSLEELEKHFSTTTSKEEKINSRRIMERIEYLTTCQKLVDKNYRKCKDE